MSRRVTQVLVIGNSQAGALKRAHDAAPERWRARGLALHFFVAPGGIGPDFHLTDGRLVPGEVSPTHPPYDWPPGTRATPLAAFDAILVSALGYVDGGFAYRNPIPRCGILPEFGPLGQSAARMPVSDRCFTEMMAALFERQPGIRTLRRLCAGSAVPVHVQPFPALSEAVAGHPDWGLAAMYRDPVAAHRFMLAAREGVLAAIAAETGARLLPDPAPRTPEGFTPRALMREDGVHQADAYGARVLDRLAAALGGDGSTETGTETGTEPGTEPGTKPGLKAGTDARAETGAGTGAKTGAKTGAGTGAGGGRRAI